MLKEKINVVYYITTKTAFESCTRHLISNLRRAPPDKIICILLEKSDFCDNFATAKLDWYFRLAYRAGKIWVLRTKWKKYEA